jgi:hypothetical protein
MKDTTPDTFLHGKEWLTKVKLDAHNWTTRPATAEEIKAAKEAKAEPTTVVVDGKTVPWTRADQHSAFAGVPLPPGAT